MILTLLPQALLGAVLLTVAVMWPRDGQPVMTVLRDEGSAAAMFGMAGWNVVQIDALHGYFLLHLAPEPEHRPSWRSVARMDGVLLTLSARLPTACRTS